MWTLISLCLLASAMGHPMHAADNKPGANVINKRSIQADGNVIESQDNQNKYEAVLDTAEKGKSIQKREIRMEDEAEQDDCSQMTGDAQQACNEQRVKRDISMSSQGDDGQNVNGTANQNGDVQEAWSNEGAYAKQGEGGQFISASDYGGPIVQILQHVYKANCCECGCNCGCPGGETEADVETTTQ